MRRIKRRRSMRFGPIGLGLIWLGATAAVAVEVEPKAETAATEARTDEIESTETEPLATVFDEILIGAAMSPLVGPERELGHAEITEIPYGDAAEVLRSVSGMAVGRMGGHGLEPHLRGMAETNINILLDGAYVHNACPNRMDPPTSFGAVDSFDRVVVLKGVQTVRYGGGGSAGTILYQRETPRFRPEERWRIHFGSAYATHTESPDLTLDATIGAPKFYLRAIGEQRDVDNYKDGGGNEVRSAFRKQDATFALGWTPDYGTEVELSYEDNLTEDALFPGAAMDAPFDENSLYRLQLRRLRPEARITAIESELYFGEIDHVMDNYSLRPLTAPMAAKAETTSDTYGGRFSIDSRSGAHARFTFGADFQSNSRRAVRIVGPDPETVSRDQSILWPDVEVTDAGVFFEGVHDIAPRSRFLFGTRLDRFEASIGEPDRKPFGSNLSPSGLYELYYGEAATDWSHDDVGGLLRLEHEIENGPTLFVGVSRSVRPADATERFLASNNSQASKRWIGKPNLRASRHHQIDLGATSIKASRQITGILFLDRVDDFILRDRARAQPGVLLDDRASIYRNVEAELFGVELDAWQKLDERFSLLGNAGWVRADNSTDRRPIAQIPPLQGRFRLNFERQPWKSSATVRYAFRQKRIDDDAATRSGLDMGETPGYAVLDLLGSHTLGSGLEIQVGVENVFDRLYADHLNRSNLFDVEQVRVNEPGRTLWLRLRLASNRDN
ncbi:MAG: TonB-dependent copper receptor [bacterium]|nr:TonB-dependent copper receptor [bacterium]